MEDCSYQGPARVLGVGVEPTRRFTRRRSLNPVRLPSFRHPSSGRQRRRWWKEGRKTTTRPPPPVGARGFEPRGRLSPYLIYSQASSATRPYSHERGDPPPPLLVL